MEDVSNILNGLLCEAVGETVVRDGSHAECKEIFHQMTPEEKGRITGDPDLNLWATPAYHLIAEDGGEPVGFLIATEYPSEDELSVFIGVLSKCQGRGVGKKLVASLLERMRRDGVPFIEWRCLKSNRGSKALAEYFGGKVDKEDEREVYFKIPSGA